MIRETNYDHLFESQKQYRTLLDCMAKPGTTALLDSDIHAPNGINKASVLVAFALLNNDVTFYTSQNKEAISSYFLLNTSSKYTDADEADFIFISGKTDNFDAVKNAKSGLQEYPELGAFIVVDTTKISDTPLEDAIKITLKGPGVKTTKDIYIKGLSVEFLWVLAEKNNEYPLGVDTFFTDEQGTIVCVPRSNTFKYLEL